MKLTLIALLAFGMTAVSAHAASTTKNACADDAHYPLISKDNLKAKVDAKAAFVIDVNSAESYKDAHVPTAIHFADHKADLAQLLPAKKDALVVAYCGGPKCEAWKEAAKKACEMGYTNVQHFKEGISGWKSM